MKNRIKTGGRKAGTPNKVTSEVREQFQHLLENNIDKMQNDIEQLEPKDRLKVMIELSKFVIPTLKATEFKQDIGHTIEPIIFQFKD